MLGYSIIASLPKDSWSISTEIWVDVVAALPDDGSRILGESRCVAAGSFASGRLVDASGRLLAECRERGRRIDDPPDFAAARAPVVVPVPSAPETGLAGLIGLRHDGDASWVEMTPVLENPRRMMHGGISLAACEQAAAWSRLGAGCELPTSSVHIVHTRAVPPDALLELRAATVHSGRSLWVTDVAGTVAGKLCATARVTAQA